MVRSAFYFLLLLVAGFAATDLLSVALEDRAIAERPIDSAPVHSDAPSDTRQM